MPDYNHNEPEEEQIVTQKGDTQIIVRQQPIVQDTTVKCQAIITSQIMVCKPMTDGTWVLVTSFSDNYNVVLDGKTEEELKAEIVDKIKKSKEGMETISLVNFLIQ